MWKYGESVQSSFNRLQSNSIENRLSCGKSSESVEFWVIIVWVSGVWYNSVDFTVELDWTSSELYTMLVMCLMISCWSKMISNEIVIVLFANRPTLTFTMSVILFSIWSSGKKKTGSHHVFSLHIFIIFISRFIFALCLFVFYFSSSCFIPK